MKNDEVIEMLKAVIKHIENNTISKQDLLNHLWEINKDPDNAKAVDTFRKFFEKEEDKEID